MNSSRFQRLRDLDFRHLWHPFTQTSVWTEGDPLIVERGEGMELVDVDGNRFLDGISSLWCNVHGHGHPKLAAAIAGQAEKLAHSTLLGLSHETAIELAARLVEIAPAGLSRVFYCDSGASAVEAALRMALEYWYNRGDEKSRRRIRIAGLEGAYHGDTLGSVSVGFAERFHRGVAPAVVRALQAPPPHYFRFELGMDEAEACTKALSALSELFERHGDEIAVLAVEPLVQGAAGIWTQPVEYLKGAAELCRKHGILLLCDEIATGFGKTGTMFACEQAGISPDLMTIGKGLTGGYMPMSAVLATEQIFSVFTGPIERFNTFFFGQTFSGNPLGAAAALASLDLFQSGGLLALLPARCRRFRALLDEKIAPLAHVDEVRGLGLMTGIELTKTPGRRQAYEPQDRAGLKIVAAARKIGLIIRPLGNVLVLMPAPAMTDGDLERLVDLSAEAIAAALGK